MLAHNNSFALVAEPTFVESGGMYRKANAVDDDGISESDRSALADHDIEVVIEAIHERAVTR